MSQLSPYNMQLFCRTCLEALRPAIETIYNIHLVPKLTELILACTTLDVNEDADFYPKNMCQLCYKKLEDFQSFRIAALRSNQVLDGITREKNRCEKRKTIAEPHNSSQNHSKKKNKPEENCDDPLALRSKLAVRGINRQKRNSVCEKIKPIAETDESQNHLMEKLNSDANDDNPLTMVSKRVLRGITSEKNSGCEKIKLITEKDNESQNHLKEKPKAEVNDNDSLALRSKRVLRSITREKRNNVCGKIKPIAATDNEFQSHLTKTQEPEENYDDELIIPELSTDFFKNSIKTESKDFEEQGKEENQTNEIYLENPDEIKNYLDSEDEENTEFYENNALGTNYHSTEYEYVEEKDTGKKEREAKKRKSSIQHTTSSERRRHNKSKKSLNCPRCDKQVYKQVYLDAHIRAVHEGHKKPFLCKKCCKSFARYNKLREHIQSVHLKTKFACDFEGCGAVFNLRTTLKTHRKVVHSTDPTLPFSLDLQKILELHQADLNTEMEIDNICQQCVKKFSSKTALRKHLKRHANIKEHICKVCGAAKVTRTELLTHMRTHDPNTEKFKCTMCPQKFNHKNAIQRHIRTVHEGLRPFSCSYCSKRFGTRNSKVCHERRHTGERPFVCEICRKGFVQPDALKGHMKNHDKSLRTHVCKYCSRRFITRKSLIDHEARHRGDKPHICEICNRGFFIRADLIYHRSSHVNANEDFYNDVADNGSSQSSM